MVAQPVGIALWTMRFLIAARAATRRRARIAFLVCASVALQ
jgi:hypothetical protein